MFFKHFFDKAVSAAGIVALSPVFAVTAAANAVHYRSSPFHAAPRYGKDGATFNILKFKSMVDLRDESGNLLPDEQRRDKWGRFLRATSLDELPQLINVLKGDMSFVGPRPRDITEAQKTTSPEDLSEILSVRPGIAGPWQVAVIGTKTKMPMVERNRLDLEYARGDISFTGDLRYILKSLKAVTHGHDGEYLGRPDTEDGLQGQEAEALPSPALGAR